MLGELYINCLLEDLPRLEALLRRLELAQVAVHLPASELSPQTQAGMVETIRQVAASGGGMVCVLTGRAMQDSLFISNIQLMCESTRSRKALIFFPLEKLEDESAIRLFAPQALRVHFTGQAQKDDAAAFRAIRQVLQPSRPGLFAFLSGHFARATLLRLLIAALVLGVGAAVVSNAFAKWQAPPPLPTPTPVVMLAPFKGQSLQTGLNVDPGKPPAYKPETDPAVEAPFSQTPAAILEQDTFHDPAFDGDLDHDQWLEDYGQIEGLANAYVRQGDGVLNMQVAPESGRQAFAVLNDKFLINMEQVTYLGMRFRLDPYSGSVQDHTYINARFSLQSIDQPGITLLQFDGIAQTIPGNDEAGDLGTRWHTLEIVRKGSVAGDDLSLDIFLDRKKINNVPIGLDLAVRWLQPTFILQAGYTDGWAGLQLDGVVFGADTPIPSRLEPAGAPYHFTPDKVGLHEDFLAPLPAEIVPAGALYVSQVPGAFTFNLPAGMDQIGYTIRFPTRPINENNYYAIRYRFTGTNGNPWEPWDALCIFLKNEAVSNADHFDISFCNFRQSGTFGVSFGTHTGLGQFRSKENVTSNLWHTLEMVISPPSDQADVYHGYFWVDGALLGKCDLDSDPARMLDPAAPLTFNVNLHGNGNRQVPLAAELNDLVIGSLAAGEGNR